MTLAVVHGPVTDVSLSDAYSWARSLAFGVRMYGARSVAFGGCADEVTTVAVCRCVGTALRGRRVVRQGCTLLAGAPWEEPRHPLTTRVEALDSRPLRGLAPGQCR